MIELIIAIVCIIGVLWLVKKLFKLFWAIIVPYIKWIAKFWFFVILGPAFGVGFVISKLFSLLKLNWLITGGCFITSALFLLADYETLHKNNIAIACFPALFLIVPIIAHWSRVKSQKKSENLALFKKRTDFYYMRLYGSQLLLCEIYLLDSSAFFYLEPVSICVLVLSVGVMIYTLVREIQFTSEIKEIHNNLTNYELVNITEEYTIFADDINGMDNSTVLTDKQLVVIGVAEKLICKKEKIDIVLLNNILLIEKSSYEKVVLTMNIALKEKVSINEDAIVSIPMSAFNLSWELAQNFADAYLDCGDYYYFNGKKRFVSYENKSKITVCASCGNTVERDTDGETWYCSSLCRETNEICDNIMNTPYDDFITDITENSEILLKQGYELEINNTPDIDISVFPQNMARFISDGYHANFMGKWKEKKRSCVYTAIIADMTKRKPYLIHMIQQKLQITASMLIQNLDATFEASTGKVGGKIGKVTGGLIASTICPVPFVSKFIGGKIGEYIGSNIGADIENEKTLEIRVKMLEIIYAQIKYLTVTLILTTNEVDNLNRILCVTITNDNIKKMGRMRNLQRQKEFATFLIKPITISLIKQRK